MYHEAYFSLDVKQKRALMDKAVLFPFKEFKPRGGGGASSIAKVIGDGPPARVYFSDF